MSRDFIASIAPLLFPVVLLALTALAGWVASLIARHITDKRQAAAVTLLAYGAAGVVADFAQHTVEALKDASKPGRWDEVTAASVKLRAIEQLRALYPFAVDTITRMLRDPAKVDELLGTLLEKAVVDLKSKAPPKPASIEVNGNVGTAIVDTSTRDGAQPGHASLSALLVILALGALGLACPAWVRPACTAPGTYSCANDQPQYCSTSGALTPIGDEPCSAQGRVCALNASGVARCAVGGAR